MSRARAAAASTDSARAADELRRERRLRAQTSRALATAREAAAVARDAAAGWALEGTIGIAGGGGGGESGAGALLPPGDAAVAAMAELQLANKRAGATVAAQREVRAPLWQARRALPVARHPCGLLWWLQQLSSARRAVQLATMALDTTDNELKSTRQEVRKRAHARQGT